MYAGLDGSDPAGKIVVLDEATSALHVRAQADMMRLILNRLSRATVISVARRPELAAFTDASARSARGPAGQNFAYEMMPLKKTKLSRIANSQAAQ